MQNKTFKFNINQFVRVRLSDFGRAIHRREWDAFPYCSYQPPHEDENGWSRWQMWDLMRTFGPHLFNGAVELPFATEIEILTDDLL